MDVQQPEPPSNNGYLIAISICIVIGLVYYFITHQGDKAYLLPMRVAGFGRMVKAIEAKTGIDTSDIRPLSQPWMYLILLLLTFFLLLVDGWTIIVALA